MSKSISKYARYISNIYIYTTQLNLFLSKLYSICVEMDQENNDDVVWYTTTKVWTYALSETFKMAPVC